MSILIFLAVLLLLVIVHEFGHFIVARWNGVHVHEFGFGFPPRAAKLFRWKETLFSLNWLPIGGFVRMEGEDASTGNPNGFDTKHPAQKLAILFAGVFFNLLLAWMLMSITLGIGVPMSASIAGEQADKSTIVASVMPDSPAEKAGIVSGMEIIGIGSKDGSFTSVTPSELPTIINQQSGNEVTIRVQTEAGAIEEYPVTPAYDEQTDTYKIGVTTDQIVFERLGLFSAIGNGFLMTAQLTKEVAVGFAMLIGGLFAGTADTSSVTGPVGLVGAVGQASHVGFSTLLLLMAIISVNLAVINLVPLPALDGGRILVTILEWIRGKQFNQKAVGIVHTIGFFLLIGVILLVTIKDIRGLF